MPTRRDFLAHSSAAFGSFAVAGAFSSFLGREARAAGAARSEGFGPLRPVEDETTGLELLKLPDGFRYRSFGWTGDPLADGTPTPDSHDGMAVVSNDGDVVTLVRNHERDNEGAAVGPAGMTYDRRGPGGCSTLRFDTAAGAWRDDATLSLAGTVRNCAGGPTPWGTWLSCEEVVTGPAADDPDDDSVVGYTRPHGWIFEVPPDGAGSPDGGGAVALKDMGRFVHEAVAVDPVTGQVYETEDRNTAGLYRFTPTTPGKLADGGRLEMLKAAGVPDLRKGSAVGQTYDVSWVPIDDPHRGRSPQSIAAGNPDDLGVFLQGKAQQATTFARLEGAWHGAAPAGRDGHGIYLNSTSGGARGSGQVWFLSPADQTLTLLFESPGREVLDQPDNLCVSPRGGLVLCEDGNRKPQRLQTLTPSGTLSPFAANNVVLAGEKNAFRGDFRAQEWAGATFDPTGEWLFANIQTPGFTVAITGPWERGGV